MLYGLVGLAQVALLAYCALNVITTPEDQVRNLPKLLWLLLVVVLPVVGPVAWLVAGRPQRGGALAHGRPTTPSSPDDDEEFLRELRRRAEEQRRRARGEDDPPPA